MQKSVIAIFSLLFLSCTVVVQAQSETLTLFPVHKKGKVGFIGKSEKIVIEPKEYHHAESFSGGLAYVVTKNGEHGYIDKTGKYIWKPAKQSK